MNLGTKYDEETVQFFLGHAGKTAWKADAIWRNALKEKGSHPGV
jgi:hypothetical protein